MQRDDRLDETEETTEGTSEEPAAESTENAPAPRRRRAAGEAAPVSRESRLRQRYRETVVPLMMDDFSYGNVMMVPQLTKAVVNIGVGDAKDNARSLDTAQADVAKITGQHPVVTRARTSIAGFKLREGMPIGTMVTLRRQRMYDFLDKLMNSALPRVRDFRGVSDRGFDGRGNYSLGIREQIIFPEIDYGEVEQIRGLQVVIVTTARTDEEGRKLLEHLGMPFVRPT